MSKRKPLDPSKTTPRSLWTDAKDHLTGARLLVDNSKAAETVARAERQKARRNPLMQPTVLLVCSSLEAGFKTYLNHHGGTTGPPA
jgi:hypothetical protein